jgi:cytochrome c-type biogenesis protein CcmE
MTPGTKLLLGGLVIAGVTAYMAYVGAANSWKYYLTADECAADGSRLIGQRMRVSGKVASQTLQVAADRRRAEFTLAGTSGQVQATCTGTLPDNLTEGMEVVVEGRLEQAGVLRGDKILTKCASKYDARQPPPTPAQIPSVQPGGDGVATSRPASES